MGKINEMASLYAYVNLCKMESQLDTKNGINSRIQIPSMKQTIIKELVKNPPIITTLGNQFEFEIPPKRNSLKNI